MASASSALKMSPVAQHRGSIDVLLERLAIWLQSAEPE